MFQVKRTKTQKGIILVGLVLFFCLFISEVAFAMASRSSPKTTVTGVVTDQLTYHPIVGASVKLYTLLGGTVASTQTDSYGKYIINKQLSSGAYFLKCQAQEYSTVSISCQINSGRTNTFNFALSPNQQIAVPKITSVTPEDHSIFVIGKNIDISVAASCSGEKELQYRYFINDKIIKGWSMVSTFVFRADANYLGGQTLKVEAKNGKGEIDSKAVDIYIVREFSKPE